MPAELILISRFPTRVGAAAELAAVMTPSPEGRIFVALGNDEVVRLETVVANSPLGTLRDRLTTDSARYAQFLTGDVRRELLEFVEAPKPCTGALPGTPYIQLRHVEVKPKKMSSYRAWREKTIFDVVRTAEEVETFLAYHSVISGQPGVMFLSGFSSAPETYGAIFESERYKTIVREAGDQFITGGQEGLYTKVYQSSTELAA